MKKTLGYLLASLVVVFVAMPAFAEIEWSGNVAVGIENIDKADPLTKENLQFTDALVNLDVKAEIADGVTAVAQIRQADSLLETRKVAVELSDLIPNATLMVGRVVFPMGKEADSQTEGANMMKNAMIGNSALYDQGVTGQLVDYGMALKTTMGAVNCLLALTNGNVGAARDNNSDKAMMIRLDGDVPAVEGLSLAASYMTNDAAATNAPKNETTNMVIDAAYAMDALTVGVTYGDGEKEVGTTKTEKDCLAIEASYAMNDTCSVAVRQSKVKISENSVDTCEVTKLQVGINYKLADNTLLKVEYVDNKNKEKPTNLKTDADYDGIKAAIAVRF
ncbi:MAG: porin [bacterium]|nr:porin [bacterium]